MHVAHFVHRYPPALGGCEAYVERLSRHLATHGDTVTVWTSTAVTLEDMWRTAGVSRLVFPQETNWLADHADTSRLTPAVRRYAPLTFPLRRYALKALSLIPFAPLQALTLPCNPVCPAMWRDAGRFDGPLDAVHAFAFPYSFPAACGLRLARRRDVPFLLTPFLHLGDPTNPRDRTRRQYTTRPLRWLLRQADRVFVQTPSEWRAVVELGVPEDRVILQGLGVDASECTGGNRDEARAAWDVDDEVVIGHLANQSEEKGTCDLLRAAASLWERGVRFRVVLAGPSMPNFRRFWERFAWRDRVTPLGVVSDAEKRDFFAGIDVFALPSRTDSFGLVLLEAWANGVPNIAYRAGGPGDLIRHDEGGRLAACGDVAELASHLEDLIANRGMRVEMGERGRSRIDEEFCWADKLDRVRLSYSGGLARRLRSEKCVSGFTG